MNRFWSGFAFGAVVGLVAATLFAPQTGRSTRRKLKRGFEDFGDELTEAAGYLKDQAERLSKQAQRILDAGKDQVSETLDSASDAAQDFAKVASSKASKATSRLM